MVSYPKRVLALSRSDRRRRPPLCATTTILDCTSTLTMTFNCHDLFSKTTKVAPCCMTTRTETRTETCSDRVMRIDFRCRAEETGRVNVYWSVVGFYQFPVEDDGRCKARFWFLPDPAEETERPNTACGRRIGNGIENNHRRRAISVGAGGGSMIDRRNTRVHASLNNVITTFSPTRVLICKHDPGPPDAVRPPDRFRARQSRL